MHVEECAEAALLAAIEEPIYWALACALHAVGLAMIGEEIVAEVFANYLTRRSTATQGIGYELEVLLEVLLTECGAYEVDEETGCIIVEVFHVREWNDAIRIGLKRRVRNLLEIFLQTIALVRQNEAGFVERIAPHHTADGIADKAYHLVALRAYVAGAAPAFGKIAHGVHHVMDAHLVQRHLDGHLVLHAVDLGEDTVEFFLVGL